MNSFRVLLVVYIVSLGMMTGLVVLQHGLNLLPIFFGEMMALTWSGQFNADFMCFLLLSGLWLAWRHHFSMGGLLLGVLGVFGGMMLLAPYLLWTSYTCKGNINVLLLGEKRAKNLGQVSS